MKKLISLMIASLMLVAALPLGVLADDEAADWEIYDNYLFYNNDNLEKTEGYILGEVRVETQSSFSASDFPEIADKILEIEETDIFRNRILHFATEQQKWTNPYTEEAIDEYISILRYLKASNLVRNIFPIKKSFKSGEIDSEYMDCDEYVHYGEEKDSGFITDGVFVILEDEYVEKGLALEPTFFGKYTDRIKFARNYSLSGSSEWFIRFDTEEDTLLTDEMLDEFISFMKYIAKMPYVKSLSPNYASYMEIDPDNPSETEGVVDTEAEAKADVSTEKNELHNPQTGDALFVLIAVASVALAVICTCGAAKLRRRRS